VSTADAASAAIPFATFIAGQDLTAVAIVDDAYDDWSVHEMRSDEGDDLWSAIENDEKARAQLSDYDPDITSGAALNAYALSEACNAVGKGSALEKVVQASAFWRRLDMKAGSIRAIQSQLHEKFGLQVHTHGIDTDVTSLPNQDVQVVFLDWRLGPDHDPLSKKRAAGKAKAIYGAFPTGKKPIIVLMSDDHELKEYSSQFRVESELIEGLFRAIPKEELREDHSLALHMLSLADSLKPAHVVQLFTDAMISRSMDAAKEFVGAIRSLTLSDYANIQHLSLRNDGKPLGDYMCWLFSGFLSDVWFGASIANERRLLDRFDFERMVASPEQPSGTLTRIYHAAVFDTTVGPVENHPLAETKSDGKVDYPNLALGDIFLQQGRAGSSPENSAVPEFAGTVTASDAPAEQGVASQATPPVPTSTAPADTEAVSAQNDRVGEGAFPATDLLAIVNAQCDLSMSPTRKRTIAPETSVMLVPGRIRPLGEAGAQSDAAFCTPLFVHETAAGKSGSWIEWNLKSLRTVPHGQFHAWASAEPHRYERIARMRPVPILALQQQLGDRNSRIGLPATPPIYRKLQVTLQLIDDRTIKSEYTDQGLAIVVGEPSVPRKPHIALTVACLQNIRKHMKEAYAGLQSGAAKKFTADDLNAALMDAPSWQKLLVPFEFPPKGMREFADLLVILPRKAAPQTVESRKTLARLLVDIDESELA
jgi:hypothetical protein